MIEIRIRGNWTIRRVSRCLGRNHSIISREIKRNKSPDGKYRADYAQKVADKKAKITNKRKLDKDETLYLYVREQLKDGSSPEQVSGRLKKCPPLWMKGKNISHESIYKYIYDTYDGRHFYHYLRKKNTPKRKKRYLRKKQEKTCILERISIHYRPEVINERLRYGDWESDSAKFKKQKAGISIQYERKSMLVRIHKVADGSAEETKEALIATAESLPRDGLFNSMTFDNGGEGACHRDIRDFYGIDTYFCDPYKSWQKGGVENIIGLIREYLPKDANMDTITETDIYIIQEKLNNRPRKKLGYLTPNEITKQHINSLGGA